MIGFEEWMFNRFDMAFLKAEFDKLIGDDFYRALPFRTVLMDPELEFNRGRH